MNLPSKNYTKQPTRNPTENYLKTDNLHSTRFEMVEHKNENRKLGDNSLRSSKNIALSTGELASWHRR